MSWFKRLRPKLQGLVQKREVPDNLWTKCNGCEQMLFYKDVEEQDYVCKHCQYHFRFPVARRFSSIFDDEKYDILPVPTVVQDPLKFRGQKKYVDRLKEAKQKTHFEDAAVLARGMLGGRPLVALCFDFDFIGGSMGMAVGEALLRGAEEACAQRAPYLVIPSSGGARIYEGILALMQMVRSVIAVLETREAKLPFVSLLTNPTTGGVAASFASLADVILAEPNAIIGFTGPRVIQETLRQTLPEGFQTSEFQRDHGFVDLIVNRKDVRASLIHIFGMLTDGKK